ncbi:MAG TPA: anti-sigma factor [Actinomycetota bacterium]|jgi:hypothetical protein|nr:anti-sigma factor [Actinomycetota bacterium]
MTRDDCRPWREDIGAYLLGGLPDERRTALLAHLDGCPACRSELAELSEVARILPAADPLRNTKREVPSQSLMDSIMDAIGDERRAKRSRVTRRVAGAVAIAAALLLGALAVGTLMDGSSQSTVQLAGDAADSDSTATLEYLPGGTRIDLSIDGLPKEETYFVWLEDTEGERVPAGTFWTPDEGGSLDLKLTAALSLRRCQGIGISDADGKTVLYSKVDWEDPDEQP